MFWHFRRNTDEIQKERVLLGTPQQGQRWSQLRPELLFQIHQRGSCQSPEDFIPARNQSVETGETRQQQRRDNQIQHSIRVC